MAWAAIASPRPMASTPSLVLPLMLTRAASTPIARCDRQTHRVDVIAKLRRLEDHGHVDVADLEPAAPRPAPRRAAAGRGSTRLSSADRNLENEGRCRRGTRRPEWRRSPHGRRRRRRSGRGRRAPTGSSRRRRRAGARRRGDAGRSRYRARPVRAGAVDDRAIASASGRSSGVVILMFDASPSTMRTGWPARSASVASSVASTPSRAAASSAAASTSRRNACGVCARKMVSRGSVSITVRLPALRSRKGAGHSIVGASARFTVSRDPSAATAAPRLRGRRNRPRDEIRADERPRRVVNRR